MATRVGIDTIHLFIRKKYTMNLIDLIQENTIVAPLQSTDRQGAISELVDVLADTDCISNSETIKQVVWERELQRTTGIGEGLAIPHGRCDILDHMVMAMGRPGAPIDFASPDKRPVELIILLVSPTKNTSDHIQALGRISRLMVDRSFREAAYSTERSKRIVLSFSRNTEFIFRLIFRFVSGGVESGLPFQPLVAPSLFFHYYQVLLQRASTSKGLVHFLQQVPVQS